MTEEEISFFEKHKLVGTMDSKNVEDFDRDFLDDVLGVQPPDLLVIDQRKRRALQLLYTMVFIDIFGEDAIDEEEKEGEEGEPTLWNLVCACMSHAFLRGYAYCEEGGGL